MTKTEKGKILRYLNEDLKTVVKSFKKTIQMSHYIFISILTVIFLVLASSGTRFNLTTIIIYGGLFFLISAVGFLIFQIMMTKEFISSQKSISLGFILNSNLPLSRKATLLMVTSIYILVVLQLIIDLLNTPEF